MLSECIYKVLMASGVVTSSDACDLSGAIEAAVLEELAKQKPAYTFHLDSTGAAYLRGECVSKEGDPLYAAPVVQPDILNDIDLILAGSHTEDCYAICGPGDETWVEEDKCNCAVGKARKLIAAAEGKSNAEVNGVPLAARPSEAV